MNKYIAFLKGHFLSAAAYRIDFFANLIAQVLEIGAVLIFWSGFAVGENIGDLNSKKILLYYLTLPLVGYLTYVRSSTELGFDIKKGNLSNYLIKPIKIWIEKLMKEIGEKFFNLIVILPIYLILFFWIYITYKDIQLNVGNVALLVFFLVIGFILHFFLDISIGWLAFWVDEVWAFRHLKYILVSILGGIAFPFTLLQGNIRTIFELLPFKYFYYVPTSYFLGWRDKSEYLVLDLSVMIFWLVIFIFLNKFLYKRGQKKYDAFGN